MTSEPLASPAPSVAENVQIMLSQKRGRLELNHTMLAAAALIELVLDGRIGSVPATVQPGSGNRMLVVIDSSPTGDPASDAALARLTKKSEPWSRNRL